MVNEYFAEQVAESDRKLLLLQNKLKRLYEEESEAHAIIHQMLNENSSDFDVFSPRTSPMRLNAMEKSEDIKKQIEQIHIQQKETEKEIEGIEEELKKYYQIIDEYQTVTDKIKNEEEDIYNPVIREGDPIQDDQIELKEILNRVEHILSLLYKDKSKCKGELLNLKYYLKSLISSK